MKTMTQTSIRYVPEQDRYCLVWRTPIMPASSFWYFATREEAEQAQAQMATPTPGAPLAAPTTHDPAIVAAIDCRHNGHYCPGCPCECHTTPTPGAPLAAPTIERHEWTESGPRHRVYEIQEVTVVNGQRIGRTLESGIAPGCPCAICTPPELPAYNPEDGAPCAQCGHGQELHVNGTEDCWWSADATPATFCPCPQFQTRAAAQRADEAAWLPMAGGAPSHYTDPAWYADEAWALQEERNAESAREAESCEYCDEAALRTCDHCGVPLVQPARFCSARCAAADRATTHTHPCPTCHQARPCTGTGCADGPRECSTCSNCRGW